jgi:hypothetical protein
MRKIVATLVSVAALAAASVQAAPVPNKAHLHGKKQETPAQNVKKSKQYDYLLSTNSSFRAYRMKKECGPIKDPALRSDCLGSFNAYKAR